MTSFFKKYQSIITVAVVVFIAFVIYTVFFTSNDDGASLTVSEGEVASPAEEELVQLLLQLRSITLDTALLEDGNFQSLQDFSQVIVEEPIGRTNPFAPLDAR